MATPFLPPWYIKRAPFSNRALKLLQRTFRMVCYITIVALILVLDSVHVHSAPDVSGHVTSDLSNSADEPGIEVAQ